jgi:hypothetical protein
MKHLSALFVTLFLTGCVHTVGADFKRPSADQLALGASSPQDIASLLGPPPRQNMNTAVAKTPEQMKDASPFDGASQPNELLKFYDYSFQKGTQKRELAFIFADDKLSSYIFLSNFPEDSTDFNDGNVSLLTKGVTTETTALQYFGQNCGREVFRPFAIQASMSFATPMPPTMRRAA